MLLNNNNPFGLRNADALWYGQINDDSAFCRFVSLDFGLRAGILNLLHIMRRFDVYFLRDILFVYCNRKEPYSFLSRILRDSFFSFDTYIEPFSNEFFVLCKCLCLIETNSLVSVKELRYVVRKFNIS